ncbi:hypothetical protein R6Q59_021872 [Mikania micrantha]
MSRSTTDIHIPVAEQVIVDGLQANNNMFLTTVFLFQHLSQILNLAEPLRRHWTHYYPLVAFGEGGVIMPHSTLAFIINALLAFTEIKSQGQPGFPFVTHPQLTKFSVTSLLLYGLASAAELVVSAAGLDPTTSIYSIIARLGRISSLCILVASLACLFYL